MQPENLRFGGGATETVLHPIVLVAMLMAIVLMFKLSPSLTLWVLLPVPVVAFVPRPALYATLAAVTF